MTAKVVDLATRRAELRAIVDRGECETHEMVERLATSVERIATLKALDSLIKRWSVWPTVANVLLELRETIENGKHVL